MPTVAEKDAQRARAARRMATVRFRDRPPRSCSRRPAAGRGGAAAVAATRRHRGERMSRQWPAPEEAGRDSARMAGASPTRFNNPLGGILAFRAEIPAARGGSRPRERLDYLGADRSAARCAARRSSSRCWRFLAPAPPTKRRLRAINDRRRCSERPSACRAEDRPRSAEPARRLADASQQILGDANSGDGSRHTDRQYFDSLDSATATSGRVDLRPQPAGDVVPAHRRSGPDRERAMASCSTPSSPPRRRERHRLGLA